jgi:asparagine synthase (glutamine-hydrolysing)
MVEHKLEHLLKWTDLNSMRFSIESRVPFLDHRLVERTLALRPSLVVHNGLTKYILREAMVGFVPPAILARRDKVGFGTPEAEWFRAPALRTLIGDLLESRFFAEQPYIEPRPARALFQRHLAGQTNAARQIWKWTNLCLWHREFVNGGQNSRSARTALVGLAQRSGHRTQPSPVEPAVGT